MTKYNNTPTKSQNKYIKQIYDMMKINIDFVVCGMTGSGKTFCIEQAQKKLDLNVIYIDESTPTDRIKTFSSTCVIYRKNVYFHFDEIMLKNSHIKKMIENKYRRVPVMVEVVNIYSMLSILSKMARMNVYFPRAAEIKEWLKETHKVDLRLSEIQKFKNIKSLIYYHKYDSDIPEMKLSVMKVVGAIVISTDINIRLKHINYLYNNTNIKYVLKIILFNIDKFYSNYEKFLVIRLLSICDEKKTLYPLLMLPKIEGKRISRQVSYPKELNAFV